MTRICPKCGSEKIRRSHRRGAAEHVLSICGLKPRRCHECNVRFAVLGSSILFRRDIDRFLRKITVIVLAVAALFAVVGAVMWVSRRDAAPPTAVNVQLQSQCKAVSS